MVPVIPWVVGFLAAFLKAFLVAFSETTLTPLCFTVSLQKNPVPPSITSPIICLVVCSSTTLASSPNFNSFE